MDPPSHEKKPEGHHAQKPRPSTGDLLSSAKVVAGAAKASLRHEADGVDKGRVAGAAADLLGAASQYGKLEEKSGLGKYAEKAEGYLRDYQASHSVHATAAGAPPSASAGVTHSSSAHSGGGTHSAAAAGAGGESGGYGDYVKLAQGLLNPHSGGGSGAGGTHSGGGGYGDYIKMAEGFLKKH